MKTHALPTAALFLSIGLTSCRNSDSTTNSTLTIDGTMAQAAVATPAESVAQISTAEAIRLAMEQFDAYLPRIEADHDGQIDLKEPHAGDFTGDGIDDVAVYFSLSPRGGGNALVGQGLALYKNTGKGVKVIAGYEPDYMFTFKRISDGRIYVEKLAYAENDGRCCPSIREEKALTISGDKVY